MTTKTTSPRPYFPKNADLEQRLAAGTCIACGEFPPEKRGVCMTCYNRQQKQINDGTALEVEFTENGWRSPSKSSGGRPAKVEDPLAAFFKQEAEKKITDAVEKSRKAIDATIALDAKQVS